MSRCDYCDMRPGWPEMVRCFACECVYHDYCAEAQGWGANADGERLCEECKTRA